MDVPNNSEDQSGDSPSVTDLIEITIKTIDSKNYQFQVENDFQIKAFKEKIALTVGIESESQRMIFCGRVLADDKTLKDYKIDNGKVIHLVKRTAPVQRNDSNRDANNQANDANNRANRRFASYRNEDGSILMGTFSLEPTSNLLNQLMRQLFSANSRGTSDNGADNSANAGGNDSTSSNSPLNVNQESTSSNQNVNSLRNRVNQIRRLLGYIETNFQILENPTQFPSQLPSFNISTEQQVLIPEYISLFNDTFTAFDRLRPHLNTYLQSLSNRSSDLASGVQTNNSILTRITHHLSHVFHLLTDFNVDPNSTTAPISLNVLNGSSIGADLLPPNSATPNVTSRVEVTSSGTTLSSSALPRFSAPSMPGMFVAQSPIVFMEIDATISGSRNVMHGVRNMSNFSPPEVNVTVHNRTPVASQNNSTLTSTSNTENSANNNGTTNASTNQSAPTNNTNNNTQNETTTNSVNNLNPFSFLSLAFDSFLPCNSAYTVPEIRSAANIGGSINFDSSSLNQQTLQQIISSLGSGLGGLTGGLSNATGTFNNALFSNLNDLFRNLETPGSQSSDEFEFFDLIRFLINQIGLTSEDSSTPINSQNFAEIFNNLSSDNNSPRISDYLRSLNLFNSTENQSLIHELLSVIFQNLDFEDLFHLITSEFHEFSRFRQPLQDFIRNHFGSTSENIPNAINELVNSNRNNLITIIANITPAQGIDSIQSFQNFISITSANFFHRILQSSTDENFETDLISALKYLVCSYIQFCKTCFADPTAATNQLILNYFEQYASYLNPRIRTYLTNTITDRINSFSSNLEISQSVIGEVSNYIVRSVSFEPEVMHVETEQDVQSISNDSETEFADAISDMPSSSTSATPKVVNENGEENWQSVVPSDWVPIINEDINRQKNIDPAHQAPFSDAYLNGMPKKRRLEHQTNGDNDVADPKFSQHK